MKSNRRSAQILVVAILIILSCIYLLPIYVMVITSLKSIEEINQGNYLLPSGSPQWGNFAEVLFGSTRFRSEMIPRLGNSIIVSFMVTALAALFGSLSGYYLSRTHSTLTRVLFVLVGIALYLPYQVVIIPLSILIARTGLSGTMAPSVTKPLPRPGPFWGAQYWRTTRRKRSRRRSDCYARRRAPADSSLAADRCSQSRAGPAPSYRRRRAAPAAAPHLAY